MALQVEQDKVCVSIQCIGAEAMPMTTPKLEYWVRYPAEADEAVTKAVLLAARRLHGKLVGKSTDGVPTDTR